MLHGHFIRFATILLAPSLNSLAQIRNALYRDNSYRKETIESGKPDPERSETTDWFKVRITISPLSEDVLTRTPKDADDKYELIILVTSHFLIGDYPIQIKHPTTGELTFFYNSKDGFLREGSATGPRLPPFSSRGVIERSAPLNPILVNFSADSRLRHIGNQFPEWREELHPEANLILQGVSELHDVVIWEPGLPLIPLEPPKPVSSDAKAVQRDRPVMTGRQALMTGEFFCAHCVPLLSHRGPSFIRSSRSKISGTP